MDYARDFNDIDVQTGEGRLSCKVHRAQGRRVIFLHGLGGTTKVWFRLVEHLPPTLEVWLVDMLWHGKSDYPEGTDYSIGHQSNALAGLIASEGISSPYVFGHSYGGWAAAQYASSHSVAGLILEAPAGLEEYKDVEPVKRRLENAFVGMENEKVIDRIIDAYLKSEHHLTAEVLARISAPTLAIWGDHDGMVDIRYSEKVINNVAGSRLEVIAGAGHNPHYTNPKDVAALLLDFIKA
ncbi:MAG: alpha/beta hydrolase [Candidatus Micrarchaeota archaeon]|nr:alpha/beta hydrolase [Candidatus Micrarchaeota archaeon]